MKRYHFHLVTYRKRPSTVQSLIKRYFSDNVGRSAAALAYYLIFSLFPFLILISSIISFLDLPDFTVESFKGLIPVDIIELANSYLSHISEIKNASLLLFGFVFTTYFTMRAVNCLLQSIHRAYRVFVALGLMTFGKNLLTWLSGWIPIDMGSISLWNLLRFVILAAVLFMVLLTLYYLVPNRLYTVRQVMPGTFASLLSWLVFSIGFAFYVENMGRYSVVYGSIGAAIVLLLWLYFSAITLIMGAEFNYLLVNRPSKKAGKRQKIKKVKKDGE